MSIDDWVVKELAELRRSLEDAKRLRAARPVDYWTALHRVASRRKALEPVVDSPEIIDFFKGHLTAEAWRSWRQQASRLIAGCGEILAAEENS